MKIKIFEANTLVGTAEVYGLDPPMHVATAKFIPEAAYDVTNHANSIDGEYVGDRSDILRLELEDGTTVEGVAISIQDWPKIDENEVDIVIDGPRFDELFSNHPQYKRYWKKD
ncbi:MAG: hypothetical protein ABJP70_01885 [Erythrobacter sp.]